MKLLIELDIKDDKIEIYKLVNRLSYEYKVVSVTYNSKKSAFTTDNLPKDFLKEDSVVEAKQI